MPERDEKPFGHLAWTYNLASARHDLACETTRGALVGALDVFGVGSPLALVAEQEGVTIGLFDGVKLHVLHLLPIA